MKGPMTTQPLRGLSTEGGMHWRGDRVTGYCGTDPCNLGGSGNSRTDAPCSENLSFNNFIVAFEGLIGGQATVDNGGGKPLAVLSTAQMQQFTDFMFQVFEPPNPVGELDPSQTPAAATNGRNKYLGCSTFNGATQCAINQTGVSDTVEDCNGCHMLKPLSGFFGGAGEQSFEGEVQNAKVPHLRNAYTKIGMFSVAGNQVRGAGFLHDGAVDTVNDFLGAQVFNLTPTEQTDLEQFILRFPSDLAPVVGQQVTLTSTNSAGANPRIDLLIQRSNASFASLTLGGTVTECDVIVKGSIGTQPHGWVKQGSQFRDDFHALNDPAGLWTDAQVRALATSEGPLTYTCAPPGSGTRMGVDRDLDGTPDGLPEPGAVLSLASGCALLAALRRRRSRG